MKKDFLWMFFVVLWTISIGFNIVFAFLFVTHGGFEGSFEAAVKHSTEACIHLRPYICGGG